MLNTPVALLARRNFSTCIKAFERVSQNKVAEVIGVSSSTLTNFKKDGDLERAMQICAALGLKVVDARTNILTDDELNGLKVWAFKGMNAERDQVDIELV